MAAPNGKLVATSVQTKNQPGRSFAVWTLTTLFFLMIAYGFDGAAPEHHLKICYAFVLPPGIGMLLTGIKLFHPRKKLEIYSDGFILRYLGDGNIIDEALWREVADITWSSDRRRTTNTVAGLAVFGVFGAAMGNALTDTTWDKTLRDLYISLPLQQKRITIDLSFSFPQKPYVALGAVTYDVWLPDAQAALANGNKLVFGDLEVSPAGIRHGNDFVPWPSVRVAKHINQEGSVGIGWVDPARKEMQTMFARLGYRGNVLVRLVNDKIGKSVT